MPVTKKNLMACMKKRQNVALVPGGVHEMMKCKPFQDINVSIKHKGFVRVAIQEGYDLVPVVMLHENDMYNNPCKDLQNWCYKMFKVSELECVRVGTTLLNPLYPPPPPPRCPWACRTTPTNGSCRAPTGNRSGPYSERDSR